MTLAEPPPVLEELHLSYEEAVHLKDGRAVPEVAACTLRWARKLTEDPGEVTCHKCLSIQLDKLGLAYGA